MKDPVDSALLATTLARYQCTDPQLPALWQDMITVQQYERGTLIARAGTRPEYVYLIAEGLVRYYYSMPEGKEWNKGFFREGQFIGSLSALLSGSNFPFSIEALEPTRLYAVAIADLYRAPPEAAVEAVINGVARELFLRNEQREAVLLTGSAEGRYRWSLDNEAWLIDRVPQYQLASYLGMEAVSLSRLKRKRKLS